MTKSSSSTSPLQHPSSPHQPYACVICCQRKVKCDKRQPCLACTKSGLHCRYRSSPPPPRRKKRSFPEPWSRDTTQTDSETLLERLGAYEALLRGAGISLDTVEDAVHMNMREQSAPAASTTAASTATPGEFTGSTATAEEDILHGHSNQDDQGAHDAILFPRRRGILLAEHGGTRYYEHGLIGGLGQKYRQRPLGNANDKQDSPSLTSILPGPLPIGLPGEPLSNMPSGLSVLWRVFQENVHPLTMVIHGPTVQQTLFSDCAAYPEYRDDCPSISKDCNALRLAIYACAVASLTDAECRQKTGEPRDTLLLYLQQAVQAALKDAAFPRAPDMDLLRAYILLMTSMFSNTDSTSLFVMMGVAMRTAQLQGLHRDGAALRLSVYETEMRRRLWWYIVSLDSRLSEVLGAESTLSWSCDTRLPSNIDDASLERGTTNPAEVVGVSDMVFCLLKYETVRFLQERDPRTSTVPEDGAGQTSQSHSHTPGTLRMRSVGALERLLEERFLRFCDPLIPLHVLTTTVARSSICKFRHMEQRGLAHTHAHASPGEHATNRRILQMAARNVAYDNLLHTTTSLRGFLWNIHFFFPWGAPIFILRILCTARTAAEWDDETMQASWAHILELHRHHPEFAVRDVNRVEHLLVADLTLEAWQTREEAMAGAPQTVPQQPVPAVILALQEAKREADKDARLRAGGESSGAVSVDLSASATPTVYPSMYIPGIDAAFAQSGFVLNSVNNVSTVSSALAAIDWTDWSSY